MHVFTIGARHGNFIPIVPAAVPTTVRRGECGGGAGGATRGTICRCRIADAPARRHFSARWRAPEGAHSFTVKPAVAMAAFIFAMSASAASNVTVPS